MTSASSSCARTRTMATRSNSPVTEYTSLTCGICAIAAAVSGMRATSALTRTIAVTTSASPGAGSQPWPVAYRPRPAWRPARPAPEPAAGQRQPARPDSRYPPQPDLTERADARGVEAGQQRRQYGGGGHGVRQGPVTGRAARPEVLRQGGQLAVGHLVRAEHPPGQVH